MTARRPGYSHRRLQETAAEAHSLVDLLRRLDQPLDSGRLRYLRRRLEYYGVDTRHFTAEALPARPRRRYGREELQAAAASSRSLGEVAARLGAPAYDGLHRHLARRLAHFGIDTSHFGRDIDEPSLRTAVAGSRSIAGTVRALGLPASACSRARVKEGIAGYGLSTTHFTGQGHWRGRAAPNRRPAEEVLRRAAPGAPRTRRAALHRALGEKGVPYVCAYCGIGDSWRGQRLVLEIDHVNGDPYDNRLRNLRYLCPSCHSQTPTHSRPGARGT